MENKTEHTVREEEFKKLTDDEKIDIVAAEILARFKPAFLELAK